MPRPQDPPETAFVPAGWQGITVEVPENWNVGAISGDGMAGYVRYDDEEMARLEIKWATERGFVDLTRVVDKYLGELQKGRKKGEAELVVEKDTKLVSKRRRKKASLKCFRWHAEASGFGVAWLCKDCGRTMIAQVMAAPGEDLEAAEELAATVLLSIEDHPKGEWSYWSAYGFGCWAPKDFKLAGQRLMAGLIEFSFAKETETIKIARWGMANVALKKRTLREWLTAEMGKTFGQQQVESTEASIKGHPAFELAGGALNPIQKLQSFMQHCLGRIYADRFVGRTWHCQPENKILYVETFVDRSNVGLADDITRRLECHPGTSEVAQEP